MEEQQGVPKVNVTKRIAGKDYTLAIRLREPPRTWLQTATTSIMAIVTMPITVPLILIWTTVMTTPLRNKVLSKLVPAMMKNLEKIFQSERSTLLQGVSGRILDVGCGGGGYFSHFQEADEIVAVEPVASLHPVIIKQHASLLDGVKTKLTILPNMESAMENEEAESFDWVILGNVLCEVPVPLDTLKQVDHFLKPGGMVYFCEHIASPTGTWMRTFQNAIAPWWSHVHGGCHCNRDSLSAIRRQPNWKVMSFNCEHFRVAGNTFVFGLAQKQGDKSNGK